MNIDIAFYNIYNKSLNIECYDKFYNIIETLFKKNKRNILKFIKTEKNKSINTYIISIYKMNCICDYLTLYDKIKKLN